MCPARIEMYVRVDVCTHAWACVRARACWSCAAGTPLQGCMQLPDLSMREAQRSLHTAAAMEEVASWSPGVPSPAVLSHADLSSQDGRDPGRERAWGATATAHRYHRHLAVLQVRLRARAARARPGSWCACAVCTLSGSHAPAQSHAAGEAGVVAADLWVLLLAGSSRSSSTLGKRSSMTGCVSSPFDFLCIGPHAREAQHLPRHWHRPPHRDPAPGEAHTGLRVP